MKVLKKIILTIAGLTACLMIGISDQMMETDTPSYMYAVLLILSVSFLHWVLHTYLMPLRQLPKTKVRELRNPTQAKYEKGFNVGTAGVGYALLLLHAYALLDRSTSDRSSVLSLAIFLIMMGTFSKTRTVVENLCKACAEKT